MSLDKVKVSVGDLKKGMFVADLDRPWLDTPFPFQGFIVTHEDIPRPLTAMDSEAKAVSPR
ncbi:DUF3391 domain-containing protein [Candidatus Reidiella endopervernicosa]|uniref:DUF3391 domain-containing protein n=1 Tax=Candidatus Reidiella endopervernicosa TaxID=2738883 RepID=A0A6N0HT24_9GAMM|nr:DUF3391 domain-containing protein [Candidatus Reidiella endopervernicosa]QKQ25371.1 DUF3391 domain-containing protein [Candidatus Reidiella endopervernicosa]